MNAAALSLFVFGIYTALSGLGFTFIPNTMLGLLGAPATGEHWIRILGVVLVGLGYYYIQVARHNIRPFFIWSVYARIGVAAMFLAFFLLGWAPATILLFGAAELAAAIWTLLASRAKR